MLQQVSDRTELMRFFVLLIDFLFINGLYFVWQHYSLAPYGNYAQLYFNFAYMVSVYFLGPIAHLRVVKAEQIVTKALFTSILVMIIFAVAILIANSSAFHYKRFLFDTVILIPTLILSRLISRSIIKGVRTHGQDNRTVVFVGAGVNLRALYDCMTDYATGYKILGYFEDITSRNLGEVLNRLGDVKNVEKYLEEHHVDMLFCNLPDSRSGEIKKIIDYCENHLVRFYSVPNVRNYVHRAMEVEYVDTIPVLSLRHEPLRDPWNAAVKRAFDILFSTLFLITCFWWIYIIVAIITKITMPGPVFFKQQRNGMLGKEFTCLKFRSMKVNDDADKVQATKDDPRKTKWGDIMRKTNIDELPQFINVFLGDMSVVGPRPHMVKHTEEYGALIDKYMVRHYAKPGITGWAQVTGSRGETSELWMMEERIKKDIWYLEHWTLMLDIKIIYKTIFNSLGGETGNAY